MIGIKAVAAYIPTESIDNIQQAEGFGHDTDFLLKNIGALRLPVRPAGWETSDLAVAAISRLISQTDLGRSGIEALIVVTQNGDGQGLPHTSAIVHEKLELKDNVAAFDISLGCSGYVYGLSVLRAFMQGEGIESGVLVTADPYSKVVSRADRVTSLLFGDAATATWLTKNAEWQLGATMFGTYGKGSKELYVDKGTLKMNGRQVFNFAAKAVPKQIHEWLASHALKPEDIDMYCIHQGSASIVSAIAAQFPGLEDRFICSLEATGNTVSSTIPLILSKHVMGGTAKRVLLTGFGVGFSWATTMLCRGGYHDERDDKSASA